MYACVYQILFNFNLLIQICNFVEAYFAKVFSLQYDDCKCCYWPQQQWVNILFYCYFIHNNNEYVQFCSFYTIFTYRSQWSIWQLSLQIGRHLKRDMTNNVTHGDGRSIWSRTTRTALTDFGIDFAFQHLFAGEVQQGRLDCL